MTKDLCDNCGALHSKMFWDFKDGSVLCDSCNKKYGANWANRILTQRLKIAAIIIVLAIALLGVFLYFQIGQTNQNQNSSQIQSNSLLELGNTCAQLQGNNCNQYESCSGTILPAIDSEKCCTTNCISGAGTSQTTIIQNNPTSSTCGNGVCETGESCSTCEVDCGRCKEKVIEDIKNTIVWVKYTYEGKYPDGSYSQGSQTGSGVIWNNDNSELTVYTNRHVVDCGFNDSKCYQKINENISIRTQDGKTYNVDQVSFAPHNLDIASLKITNASFSSSVSVNYNENPYTSDKVIAIGYPSYADNVVEFSVSEGSILTIKDLLMNDGFAFKSIESDAYTNFGSSGGGLFDTKGNLVGITTWGDYQSETRKAVAITTDSLKKITEFHYCKGNTFLRDSYCIPYCPKNEILGNDNRCHSICKEFYCKSNQPQAYDIHCKDGYILGTDGYCHLPCGSSNIYCNTINSVCYKNQCINCSNGTYLYTDGTCKLNQ